MYRNINPKKYTWLYIVALSIIASLSILSHALLNHALKRNEGFAALINISGRQRMFSQRIISLSLQYERGDKSAQPKLNSALERFQAAYQYLLSDANQHKNDSQSYKLLHHLYHSGNYSLNYSFTTFIRDAQQVARARTSKSIPQNKLTDMIKLANNYLLSQLDEAVHIYQSESEYRLERLKIIQWAILFVVLFTLLMEAVFLFRPMIIRLIRFTEELLRLATHDGLTQLYNQSYFIERAHVEAARAKRSKQPLSLMIIDIDFFKKINDTYGHSAGDRVLRVFAEQLSHLVRPMDATGRVGGEEFAIILPDTPLHEATFIAERICHYIQTHPVPIDEENKVNITISIGVTEFVEDIDTTIKSADNALYRAKKAGRNCVKANTITDNN